MSFDRGFLYTGKSFRVGFSIGVLLISMHGTTENFGFKVTFKLVLHKDNLVFKKKRTLIAFRSHWHLEILKQTTTGHLQCSSWHSSTFYPWIFKFCHISIIFSTTSVFNKCRLKSHKTVECKS